MNVDIDISSVILKTERLILRPWTVADADDLYEYARVDGVGQMAGWLPHESKDTSLRIVRSFIEHKKTFALEYNGKVIGSLGIERYKEEYLPEFASLRGRELGYVLSKDYWGRGMMAEAVKEATRYLFNDVKLDFLACGHYADNPQSQRVQEKCGFTHYKKIQFETRFGIVKDGWLSILKNERATSHRTHEMQLQKAPFRAMKSGTKTIEMRLFDEKRRSLAINDFIRFTNTDNGEALLCKVIALHRFEHFDALYRQFDKTALGYQKDETAHPDDMLAYYPKESVQRYGVVGIEIQVIK